MRGPVTYRADHALRLLVIVGLGTMAFSMQDVLLEPYGGQVLAMTVSETTRLSATLAGGGLLGFAVASYVLSQGADPFRMADTALWLVLQGSQLSLFQPTSPRKCSSAFGISLIGLGGGLFGHGTLTATMNLAPKDQAGLSLGTWGAVQACAAGIAVALGALLRDAGYHWAPELGVAAGYHTVYLIEALLLLSTLAAMYPLFQSGAAVRTERTP